MKKKVIKKSSIAKCKNINVKSCHTSGGCLHFLGFVGAAVYYIQSATSFWMGVLGVLKALVWPAILIYKLLGFLGA